MDKAIIMEISKAIEYFNADLPQISKFNQKQFEKNLIAFQLVLNNNIYQKIRSKIIELLISKYFYFVKHKYAISQIQEYLIEKLIDTTSLAFLKLDYSILQSHDQQNQKLKKETTNLIVVFYSSLMSHLTDLTQLSFKDASKCSNVPSDHLFLSEVNQFKKNTKKFVSIQQKILLIIKQSLTKILNEKCLPIQSIYPKTFSGLSQTLDNLYESNYKNFEVVLSCLQLILDKNRMKLKKQIFSIQKLSNYNLVLNQNNQQIKTIRNYSEQCLFRLIQLFKKISKKAFNLTLPYRQKIMSFLLCVKQMKQIFQYQEFAKQFFKLSQSLEMDIQITFLNDFTQKFIKQKFTQQWILLINSLQTKISTQKIIALKQIKSLQKYVKIENYQDADKIIRKLKESLFPCYQKVFVQVNENISYSSSIPLTQLKKSDSYSTYPLQLSALQDSCKFQHNKIVVQVFSFFQNSHQNLNLFGQILKRTSFETKQIFLECLINNLLMNTYNLQMNLVCFYELLKILFLINLIVTETQLNKLNLGNKGIVKNLWSWITNNMQIKKLQVRGKQQELLVYWITRISLKIYFLLVDQQKKQMKKLHYKVKIVELLFQFMQHKTYLLQLVTTYSFLFLTYPLSIEQFLVPLYSTILHRNYKNLHIVKHISKLSNINRKQSEQLIQTYLRVPQLQIQQVLIELLHNLKTETIRKCILTAKKWYLLLTKKTIQLLNNQTMKQQPKGQMFHMNDGQNVTIDNALGVIIIELKQKWSWELSSPKKQIIIDVILTLLQTNNHMVFFKTFFNQILNCFINILKHVDNQQSQRSERKSIFYERIRLKIYKVLVLIPKQNFNLYQKQISKGLSFIIQNQHETWKKYCFVQGKSDYFQFYKNTKQILQKIKYNAQI